MTRNECEGRGQWRNKKGYPYGAAFG